MKTPLLLVIGLFTAFFVTGQDKEIDRLKQELGNAKTDTLKINLLDSLSVAFQPYKPDSTLILAQTALILSQKIKYIKGESKSLNQMAGAFSKIGNYPKALEYYLRELKILEKINDPFGLAVNNASIANVFNLENDFKKALKYELITDSIIQVNSLDELKVYIYLNVGDIYEKTNQLDSAIINNSRAYKIAKDSANDFMIGASLNNFGNIYSKCGDIDLAIRYYEKALPFLEKTNNEDFLCEAYLGLANLFDQAGKSDSSEYFARRSLKIAETDRFEKRILDASSFLTSHFRRIYLTDSVIKFQDLALAFKDSIYSSERIRQLQLLSIDEELRQKEFLELKKIENDERKQRLQLLALGIFIPIFFLLNLLLSNRRIKARLIEFTGILSLLLLFEYLTLLLHPAVEDMTHHSPFLEIIIFVSVAAILTPAHHKIEHWLLKRLAHKKPISMVTPVEVPVEVKGQDLPTQSI